MVAAQYSSTLSQLHPRVSILKTCSANGLLGDTPGGQIIANASEGAEHGAVVREPVCGLMKGLRVVREHLVATGPSVRPSCGSSHSEACSALQ